MAAPGVSQDAEPVLPLFDRGHETEGFKTGYFTPAGERVARLLIDRVGLEYRSQGFLRVAWRPMVVLEGVTLEVSDPSAAWSAQGSEILRTMRTLGGRNEVVLRRVLIRVAGAPEITASAARIRSDGGLELTLQPGGPGQAAAPPRVQYFWLTGPQAGRLTETAPPRRAATAPPAPPNAR